MKHTNTVIIGGGQAGLAMSRCLVDHHIDHIILERGRIAERWRSERWDSLRLLTPNWQSRLPHWHYQGDRPDDFMTMPEYVSHLKRYAESFEAPIQTGTEVLAVERRREGKFNVRTDRGDWVAQNVVVATGFCDQPRLPDIADALPNDIFQLVPSDYRNPAQLPDGNVLVVGASATGLQIADELLDAGREVTIAVGTHVRAPRRYRGRDILYWMDKMGAFAAAADPAAERATPAPQLIGTPENRDLDIGCLWDKGAQVTGRALAVRGDSVYFADDLVGKVNAADEQMMQLLAKIDAFIETSSEVAGPPDAPARVRIPYAPDEIDLRAARVTTVIWATGYKRHYPWLKLPVFDERGEIRHDGGVAEASGLYVLGIRFQRRKNSNLIDGVGRDAEDLSTHLANRVLGRAA